MTETMVQFSIFLGSKPALLAQVCRDIAKAKINIVALTMMPASEHSVLRIVAEDPVKVREVLRKLNLEGEETRVLAVTMPNKPGAAAEVCERLSAGRVQISYLYSTSGAPGGRAIGILKVSNAEKAAKILENRRPAGRDMKVKLRKRQRAVAARR